MTEARWRALLAVADTGSIRAAAARMFVTEPAVSAAIASLSREVGAPLLERVGRGVQLTAPGERYAEYLRRVRGLLDEAAIAARGELDPARGLLRLAAVTTVGDRLVPELLRRFRQRHPDVEMRLEVGPSARVWQLFADRMVDVVVAGRPPDRAGGVVRARREHSLVVVGAPEVVGGWNAATTTWLLREPGSGTRATCEALISDLAASGPTMTLGSIGAVVAGAGAGLGVTLATWDLVAADVEAGRLAVVPLPGLPLLRRWHAVTRHRPVPVADLFVRFLAGQDGWQAPRERRTAGPV